MSILETEIAIIGAGPAGATTSIFLSKAGIPHVIFDKAEFPRDKICGDALSGKVGAVLNKIDPDLVYQLDKDHNVKNSWGVRFVAPNGTALDVPFIKDRSKEKHAPGFIVKRLVFDKFLVDLIDADFVQKKLGCSVTGISDGRDYVAITYQEDGKEKQCRARMVIGAGGDRCVVARQMANRKIDPRHYAAGMRGYFENVGGMHPQNFIELHFIPEVLPGYLWIFPLADNQANVGIGLLSSRLRKKNFKLKKMMLDAISNHPELRERFKNARLIGDIKGWGLPLGAKRRRLSGNRFILTGDAASLIDPFTGEGIGNAMFSGRLAAQLVQKLRSKNDYSAQSLKIFDDMVYDALWNELQISYKILKLVDFPWLFNWVVNRAIKNKTLQDTIISMFENLDVRAQLKKPSFYFKLLFNR